MVDGSVVGAVAAIAVVVVVVGTVLGVGIVVGGAISIGQTSVAVGTRYVSSFLTALKAVPTTPGTLLGSVVGCVVSAALAARAV